MAHRTNVVIYKNLHMETILTYICGLNQLPDNEIYLWPVLLASLLFKTEDTEILKILNLGGKSK